MSSTATKQAKVKKAKRSTMPKQLFIIEDRWGKGKHDVSLLTSTDLIGFENGQRVGTYELVSTGKVRISTTIE